MVAWHRERSLSVPHSAMEEVDKGVAGITIGEGEQGAESAPNVPLEKLNLPGELSAVPAIRARGLQLLRSGAAPMRPPQTSWAPPGQILLLDICPLACG